MDCGTIFAVILALIFYDMFKDATNKNKEEK